ncbi:serine/threonine protein kinase [Nonomuraea sp. K274]|uniref:non-specific serine/threonine protein kinase n=1 Tax=Nonomuraea cypriaca TaxID=1187855 RepID=A0A931A742_9ACTN|nr:serine/threonine-protein kinase [Nonomuraea cypriaca]MBF8187602.1 serine/threonine protein kinase [Nonomuraea cypriaca]
MSRLEPGDVLARRYLLLDPLARGGMSVIWRAFDQSLHRMIAVKVLTASLHMDHGERISVRSEARAAARFIHPDTIEIYDYGETVTTSGGVAAYVVMPLLDGTPLAERVEAGPLPWTEAAAIALRLARVLMAGHARGLVHRDVTAENVLLTADGPKLLDFGIAAWAGDPEDDRGTPPYVAPERLLRVPTHPAVDVYALGVLLHTMLTGRTPYPETTWEEIEVARRTSPPPRAAGVPHSVASLCQSCLAHLPEERPTAAEIVTALTAALSTATLSRNVRRGLTVTGSAVIALSALLWFQQAEVPQQREKAPVPTPSATVAPTETATAKMIESSPSATVTIDQAVTGFTSTLEARTPCGATDADVVLDLKQVLHATVTPLGPYESSTDNVRRKLSDRLREGRLSPACLSELEARLDVIDAAIKRK